MGAAEERTGLIKEYLSLVHCTSGFEAVEEAEQVTRFEQGRFVILGRGGEQRLTTAQFKREIERLRVQLRTVGGVLGVED